MENLEQKTGIIAKTRGFLRKDYELTKERHPIITRTLGAIANTLSYIFHETEGERQMEYNKARIAALYPIHSV